jgi:hypothetical protein
MPGWNLIFRDIKNCGILKVYGVEECKKCHQKECLKYKNIKAVQ